VTGEFEGVRGIDAGGTLRSDEPDGDDHTFRGWYLMASDNTEQPHERAAAGGDDGTAGTRDQAAAASHSTEPGGNSEPTEQAADSRAERERTRRRSTAMMAAGAAAVVSTGLGVVSLTGTALGDMLRSRQEIIGQIESTLGGGGDQVDAFYGTPWHTAAIVNWGFAMISLILGIIALALLLRRADAPAWAKALALGGLVLGAAGVFVSAGMYFDIFGGQPQLPSLPGQVPGGGG
jgi:hypothetical protein